MTERDQSIESNFVVNTVVTANRKRRVALFLVTSVAVRTPQCQSESGWGVEQKSEGEEDPERSSELAGIPPN